MVKSQFCKKTTSVVFERNVNLTEESCFSQLKIYIKHQNHFEYNDWRSVFDWMTLGLNFIDVLVPAPSNLIYRQKQI